MSFDSVCLYRVLLKTNTLRCGLGFIVDLNCRLQIISLFFLQFFRFTYAGCIYCLKHEAFATECCHCFSLSSNKFSLAVWIYDRFTWHWYEGRVTFVNFACNDTILLDTSYRIPFIWWDEELFIKVEQPFCLFDQLVVRFWASRYIAQDTLISPMFLSRIARWVFIVVILVFFWSWDPLIHLIKLITTIVEWGALLIVLIQFLRLQERV